MIANWPSHQEKDLTQRPQRVIFFFPLCALCDLRVLCVNPLSNLLDGSIKRGESRVAE